MERTPSDTPLKGVNILVVDDDKTVLQMTDLFLNSFGATVTSVDSGRKGMDEYTNRGDQFDVILLDYMMPQIDGADVHDYIRTSNSIIPIIFVTGSPDQDRVQERIERNEFTLLIKKPCQAEAMVDEILKYFKPKI